MTSWILGFDLSLSAPAAVALPRDWRPGDWKRVKAWILKPPAPFGADDLSGHCKRYIAIADWTISRAKSLGRSVKIYVESYGYNKSNANAAHIMESGGVVRTELYKALGYVMIEVASSAARKLTLGFSPRKPKHDAKGVIQDAVFNKFGAPKTWTDNECDAFLVAQYGLSAEGGTILSLAGGPVACEMSVRRRKKSA